MRSARCETPRELHSCVGTRSRQVDLLTRPNTGGSSDQRDGTSAQETWKRSVSEEQGNTRHSNERAHNACPRQLLFVYNANRREHEDGHRRHDRGRDRH